MKFQLSQRFYFDAAHTLQRALETESSRRIHGHTYSAEITVIGTPDPQTGMVLDLGLVRIAIAKLRETLDHHLLDEVPGLGIPTLENLCLFILETVELPRDLIQSVRVWREGQGDGCLLLAHDAAGA
ncbi:6-carboxytetrahydropterin synthase [Hydrogenophaga sp. PAMC20947]|uniref:6-carboxytetrahydropterin synthase n=1 Tax=Hydrogenophaga sp. PAMC20947 TaxID=2565558 RepID=UPI00109DA733|nr:6-carboxytetrahydropterin synthase [Hydrogenophaga sp. PAMC20947]QCB46311.1 6-carboxytetrahydropterin synthase [Hydrogenophaga sp. PAMC20947]